MAVSLLCLLTLAHSVAAAASPPLRLAAAAAVAVCPRQDRALLDAAIRSQCPLCIHQSSPLDVSGETLEKELSRIRNNVFYSVLFYASWCPFSRPTRSTFDALSTIFPQIRHLVVEESSALPSLFSRYGVHSFPSILLVNGATRVRYHGPKDLSSLVLFYKEFTGLHPVADFSVDQYAVLVELANEGSTQAWARTPRETLSQEPYLAFSLLFLCLRALLYFFPEILSWLKVVWFSYVCHVNWGIFGEWDQLLERALHTIDVKRLWNELSLSNMTNFQKGANNARVWASSFTSVSLGESSTSRSAPLDS